MVERVLFLALVAIHATGVDRVYGPNPAYDDIRTDQVTTKVDVFNQLSGHILPFLAALTLHAVLGI